MGVRGGLGGAQGVPWRRSGPPERPLGGYGASKKSLKNHCVLLYFCNMEDLGGRSGGPGVPKGISGGAEGVQGEPKGGPRGVKGGPRGDFGGVRKRSEKRRRLLVVGRDLLGPFWEVRRLRGTRRRGKGRINLPWIWVLEPELIF